MVQVGQLQMQLQQLHTERQRLELEEKKELRLAQENRVMRMFVDLYEQAQTYRLQGQVLDFVVVALASFRMYRQIYNDLDDANNRLKLSDLRERLFNTISETLRDRTSREALAEAYAHTMQQPLQVLASGQQAKALAVTLLNSELGKAEASNARWDEAASSAAIGIDRLQQARQAMEAARQELGRLLGAQDLREYFFPLQQDASGGLLVGLSGEWQAWVAAIETRAGQRLADVYQALDRLPVELDQKMQQTAAAVEQFKHNQLTYQLAEALDHLGTVLPGQRALYQELNEQYKPLQVVPVGNNAAGLLDNLYRLHAIQANLIASFGPLQRYLDQNRNGADERYRNEATRRLQGLGGESKASMAIWLESTFGLYAEVVKLNQAISGSIVAHRRKLRKAAATSEGFAQLRARAAQLVDDAQLAEVDRLAANPPTGLAERARSAAKTQNQRQADQHWRWVEAFMRIHPPAAAQISSESQLLTLITLPLLDGGGPGKPVPPLYPEGSAEKTFPWLRVLAGVIILGCLALYVLANSNSKPAASLSLEATATRHATASETLAATLTVIASPIQPLEPTITEAAIIASSPTPEPTATSTSTSTLNPSITPPTATRTATPTTTPTVTRTATRTRTPTKTLPPPTDTRTPTSRPSTPTTVALDNVIVNTSAIIDAPTNDVEKLLGNPTEIVAMGIGDAEEIPDGGESRTYQVGKYTLYVNYNKQGIAKGLQVVDGLKDDGYTLDQWPLVLTRIGVGYVGQPDIVAPAARNWTNASGYAIMIVADSIGGTVWSVRIYKIP